ncbi:MAG TPA: hypothetical protein VH438_01985, partial [Gemmatimonadales bacterium]
MFNRLPPVIAVLGVTLVAPLSGQGFNYGATVAVGANEILVGQPANQYSPGYVYVYRSAPGAGWKLASRLSADGAENNDGFGASIALDGNTALVSSTSADSARGAVFVLTRDPAGKWKQTGRISAPN